MVRNFAREKAKGQVSTGLSVQSFKYVRGQLLCRLGGHSFSCAHALVQSLQDSLVSSPLACCTVSGSCMCFPRILATHHPSSERQKQRVHHESCTPFEFHVITRLGRKTVTKKRPQRTTECYQSGATVVRVASSLMYKGLFLRRCRCHGPNRHLNPRPHHHSYPIPVRFGLNTRFR